MTKLNKVFFEKLYKEYNKKKYISPDPLEFVHQYKLKEDQELVAIIASSLAYGRVAQILKSVKIVLDVLGPNPKNYILNDSRYNKLNYFKHRFTTSNEIINLLKNIKKVIIKYNSLENCFIKHYKNGSIQTATEHFALELGTSSLISDPRKASALKRLNLFFRWMVRDDDVDLGCWSKVDKSDLIIPLDTHMYQFGIKHGFTSRKCPDLKTAIEITNAFKKFSPSDPVKYDFAITRFGIRKDLNFKFYIEK